MMFVISPGGGSIKESSPAHRKGIKSDSAELEWRILIIAKASGILLLSLRSQA
jgi:hypothetical protein